MMRFRAQLAALLLGLTVGCATSTTGPSGVDVSRLLAHTAGPFLDLAALQYGRVYLLYPVASFFNKNGRWPKDYAELLDYVQRSDGYLTLGQYEQVDLRPLSDGGLEVHYVPKGGTNEVAFTLGPVTEKH